MNTRNYCTLFDSKYLPQGLALYESLVKHSSEPFTLYVLPMDGECARILKAMALPKLEIVNVEAFEESLGMEAVKANRTFAEYCYTCASCLAEFLMGYKELPEISYVDADCWFMADPEIVFDEIGDSSIGIIPHRFADKDKVRLMPNGEFNVSIVHFKSTPTGRECLQTWARSCRNWCYMQNHNGKYADQGYLNDWPGRYGAECCVIQNIGVGVAPWNLQQYRIVSAVKGRVYLDCHRSAPERIAGQVQRLEESGLSVTGYHSMLFCRLAIYHFHETRFNEDGTVRLTNYPLRPEDINLIYKPYIAAVAATKERIGALQPA